MWELDYRESWVPKNWCFWTVVLEKTLESPLDCKEIKPVNPRGNQSWIFSWRADAEAKTLILWLPDAKNQLIGKDSDAGKDWRQEEKGTTEDEMVGWHHGQDGHDFEKGPEVDDGQGKGKWKWRWSHSVVSDSLGPLWTVAYQAPLSMGFSRQGYWSRLPFPSPGIFPTQGLNPGLLHCRQKPFCACTMLSWWL